MVDFGGETLRQLLVHGPSLVVGLMGVVLSLVNLRRCLVPSLMTLIASGLMLMGTVTSVGLQMQLMAGREALPRQSIGLAFTAVGLVRTIAVGVVIAAVFVGRRETAPE